MAENSEIRSNDACLFFRFIPECQMDHSSNLELRNGYLVRSINFRNCSRVRIRSFNFGTILRRHQSSSLEAPPHRFRELFPAGTLKPRARIMLDGPKPVAERKITRIDLFFKGPVTRQQPTPHSRMIRYFAIMEQSRLVS